MKGAEKAHLFETAQYGKLYIISSKHARGKTLRIQVLPEGEKAIPNGKQNPCLNENAVMVYGVVSGNPGWTETYGWLHEGKWQEDFYRLVEKAEEKNKKEKAQKEKREKERQEKERERISKLLNSY